MAEYYTEPVFTLIAKEAKSFASFIKIHTIKKKCKLDVTFRISFNSGIGRNVVVKCKCGAERDITDYGSW